MLLLWKDTYCSSSSLSTTFTQQQRDQYRPKSPSLTNNRVT